MEEKKEEKNGGFVGWIVVSIIVVIIFATITTTSNPTKNLDEMKLIEEGKIKEHNEVINEIVEVLKNRDEEKLKEYLRDDFIYYNDNRNESKYTYGFWNDLKYLVENNYDIEKRGNDIEGQETYRIYWNTNNLVKERTNRYYCLQKITIVLDKIVKQDIITYEIEKIILTNN